MIQGESKDTHFFVYFTMLLPCVLKRNQASKLKKSFFSFNVVCSRFEENSIIEIWEEKFGRKLVTKKVNCGLSLALTITCALIHFCCCSWSNFAHF